MTNFTGWTVLLLMSSLVASDWSHHHHRHHKEWANRLDLDAAQKGNDDDESSPFSSVTEKTKRSLKIDEAKSSSSVPFSARRLEKMLEKAILKIITGDLSTADMLLLKSLNYSRDEIMAIREYELGKEKEAVERETRERSAQAKLPTSPSSSSSLENDRDSKEKRRAFNSVQFNYSPRSPNADAEEADLLDETKRKKKHHQHPQKTPYDEDFDFDAYNRQAVLDYENLASKMEVQQSWSEPIAAADYEEAAKEWRQRNSNEGAVATKGDRSSVENVHKSFDKAMEPHVIFKIRYDDSDFDSSSSSDERSRMTNRKHHATPKAPKHRAASNVKQTPSKNSANSFHSSSSTSSSSSTFSTSLRSPLPSVIDGSTADLSGAKVDRYERRETASTSEFPKIVQLLMQPKIQDNMSNVVEHEMTGILDKSYEKDGEVSSNETKSGKRANEYEGLEWVEDDVYRVIPSIADSLSYEGSNDDSETSDYEEEDDAAVAAAMQRSKALNSLGQQNSSGKIQFNEDTGNDTVEYQNDTPDPVKLFMANVNSSAENQSLSTYEQLAIANRKEGNLTSPFDSQGKKAMDEIKLRVLVLTGRFNLSTSANQVQREKLTMFSPTCQIPRNTDPDVWAEPYSMNMHFQLNLTSGDHVVAAKLRIYKLPQSNVTISTAAGGATTDEEEEDEKKIRISVYYYTKSLKKHRSKKRLMDSVVTPLTPEGSHLALDVRQGLKFWRLNPRSPHSNGGNHGLVVQIEDQDGKPLKPALYVQSPSCSEGNSDEKTSNYLHFSYEPVLVTFAS